MINNYKSLIYSKLRRGGVNSQFSVERNDRKVVSVAPYYYYIKQNASMTERRGSVVDAFFCVAMSRSACVSEARNLEF